MRMLNPLSLSVVLMGSLYCQGFGQQSHPAPIETAPRLPPEGPEGPPGPNTLAIALLRWYNANEVASFEVGNTPTNLAFDGANIWLTNLGSNTVTKLRASDGASLCTFSVGRCGGVAFDGANIWVSCGQPSQSPGFVAKLRASDGTILGKFPVGDLPQVVAFDGANIWVANYQSATVTKLRASDGSALGTFPAGNTPSAAVFDGANIWVTNTENSNTITKLRASDGTILGTFAVGNSPYGGCL